MIPFQADVHFEGKSFPAATVNGSLLGPTIHVAVGERLSLSVELSSAIRDLSIHFHGFEMKGQQAYDGVVGITQCAIRPGMNFTYDFAVNEKAGTYWYIRVYFNDSHVVFLLNIFYAR